MPTVKAPAKINLTLEVLGKRPDGYHEIRSVIQTINLYDSLRFGLSKKLRFSCDNPDLIMEESLISRAAALLQQASRFSKGATIEVVKKIPFSSGLGGDSSDAAAILQGLNNLWELGLSLQELLELAPRLGSDVAFFVYGGTALVEGRGERVTPLSPLPRRWVVLMVPPLPRTAEKTRQLYASLKPEHYTQGQFTDSLVGGLTGGEVPSSMLFNVFDGVAPDSFPRLGEYWEQFLRAGATDVHLAGSGPTLFTLIEDKAQAEGIYKSLQQQGMECYLTETLAAIKRVA